MELNSMVSPRLSWADVWDLLANNPREAILAFVLFGLTLVLLFSLRVLLLGPSFSLRRMTLPSLLLNAYLIIMPVPSILWFLASPHPVRYTNLIAVDLAPLLLLFGVWCANVFFRIPPTSASVFLRAELVQRPQDHFFRRTQTLMLGASMAIVIVYLVTARFVPLIASFQDYGRFDADPFRHSIYNLPDALIFAYAAAARLFLPFCVLYSFLMARLYGKAWRLRFWVTLLFSLVAASLSLERSPTLGIFLVLLVAYPFTSKKRFLLRYAGVVLAALFAGGLIHQAQYQLDIERTDVFEYMSNFLLNRIWLDPSYMTAVAFREFNFSTAFLGGQSIRLLSLFGIPYRSFSSVGFVGDLWANFGWTGVIAGSTLLGFVLQLIQGKIFRTKTLSVLVIYVLFLVNVLWLLYGSILSTMVVTVFAAGLLLLRTLPRTEAHAPSLGVRRNLFGRSLGQAPQRTS